MNCRMFSSLPSLSRLHMSGTHACIPAPPPPRPVITIEMSLDPAKCPQGSKITHFENHCFNWSSGPGLSAVPSFLLYLCTQGELNSSYGLLLMC